MSSCYGTYFPPKITGLIPYNFEKLVPKSMVRCTKVGGVENCKLCEFGSGVTQRGQELGFVMFVAVLMVFSYTAFILYRSMSRIYTDYYRILFIYVMLTIPFPVLIFLGPQGAGFTRYHAFPVFIHNMAEYFFLFYLWIGSKGVHGLKRLSVIFITYVYIMAMTTGFIRSLPILYFWLMVQGASLDFILVYTFAYASMAVGSLDDSAESVKKIAWGIGASVAHCLSILPFFYGMALASSTMTGITTLIVSLPFMIYAVWASEMLSGFKRRNLQVIEPLDEGIAVQLSRLTDLMIVIARQRAPEKITQRDRNLIGSLSLSPHEVHARDESYMLAHENGDYEMKNRGKGGDGGDGDGDVDPSSPIMEEILTNEQKIFVDGLFRFSGKTPLIVIIVAGILSACGSVAVIWTAPCYIDAGAFNKCIN